MGLPLVFAYESRTRAILVGIGVTILALAMAEFATIPAFLMDPVLLEGDFAAASRSARSMLLALNFIGMALAGVLYLWMTDRGWEWLDLKVPDRSDFVWMLAGLGLLIGFYVVFVVILTVLDVPAAGNQGVLGLIGDDVVMILVMIAVVFLLNAPAEEFVFRNIVQKRLYPAFGDIPAVIIAALIFTIIHIPVFMIGPQGVEEPLAVASSMIFILGGSVIFGYLYVKTRNLLVPIVLHAVINAFQMILYLLSVLYGVEEEMQGAILLLPYLVA